MNRQQPTNKPVKMPSQLGQPVNWTDQAIADLSDISPADLQHAASLWQSLAPAGYKGLLTAGQDEGDTTNVKA